MDCIPRRLFQKSEYDLDDASSCVKWHDVTAFQSPGSKTRSNVPEFANVRYSMPTLDLVSWTFLNEVNASTLRLSEHEAYACSVLLSQSLLIAASRAARFSRLHQSRNAPHLV